MLRDAGWNVVESMAFQDHHRFTGADVAAIESKRTAAGADVVFTTDKDGVRLEGLPLPFEAYRVPLSIEFNPPDALMASVLAVLQ
jgi:tetraacyldisaccharide 4'-kinase